MDNKRTLKFYQNVYKDTLHIDLEEELIYGRPSSEIRDGIDYVMDQMDLDEIEQDIVSLYYGNGLKMVDIALSLFISQNKVSKTIKKVKNYLLYSPYKYYLKSGASVGERYIFNAKQAIENYKNNPLPRDQFEASFKKVAEIECFILGLYGVRINTVKALFDSGLGSIRDIINAYESDDQTRWKTFVTADLKGSNAVVKFLEENKLLVFGKDAEI